MEHIAIRYRYWGYSLTYTLLASMRYIIRQGNVTILNPQASNLEMFNSFQSYSQGLLIISSSVSRNKSKSNSFPNFFVGLLNLSCLMILHSSLIVFPPPNACSSRFPTFLQHFLIKKQLSWIFPYFPMVFLQSSDIFP